MTTKKPLTSREMLRAPCPPGMWWWNVAPFGEKPRWVLQPVPVTARPAKGR